MLTSVNAASEWSMMLYNCILNLALSKMVEPHVEMTLSDIRMYEPEC